MNRLFTIILVAALLLVAVSLTACQEEEEHVHTFEDHKVAATCVSNGYVEHTCTECGYYMRDSVTDKDPENHTELKTVSVTAPGCEMGYTTSVCEGCRQNVYSDYTSPVHSFGDWELVETPVCPNDGVWERACGECGYVEQEMKEAEHVIENEVTVEATVYASGYTKHYCDCGKYYYIDSYVAPLSAEYLEFQILKDWAEDLSSYTEYCVVVGLKSDDVEDVVIPSDYMGIPVTVIDYQAFVDCDSIKTVTITDNIEVIRTTAFWYCDGLEKFVYTGTLSDWANIDKGSEWESYVTDYVIECSDGIVKIEEEETPAE